MADATISLYLIILAINVFIAKPLSLPLIMLEGFNKPKAYNSNNIIMRGVNKYCKTFS